VTLDSAKQVLGRLMDRNGSGWRKMRELYGAGAVAKFTEEERLLDAAVRDYDALVTAYGFIHSAKNAGWAITIEWFTEETPGHIAGPLVSWLLMVDAEGRGLYQTRPFPIMAQGVQVPLQLLELMSAMDFPALLAISLMHCKNVKRRSIIEPGGARRKYRRTYGFEPVQYHTLEINPMRRVLEHEGGMQSGQSLQRSLHICRGHFRTYSEKRLFGRLTGTFWIPMHARGAADQGTVVKDYRIKGPFVAGDDQPKPE
jgi:hypothetical protein